VVVALRIGDVLGETGCQKLKYVYPGKYVAVIWDFTSLPEGTVDEAARKEVLERVGYKPEAAQ
jgi:8-oxo-dGTP pyrophosphatase MutT (NUDIX family)